MIGKEKLLDTSHLLKVSATTWSKTDSHKDSESSRIGAKSPQNRKRLTKSLISPRELVARTKMYFSHWMTQDSKTSTRTHLLSPKVFTVQDLVLRSTQSVSMICFSRISSLLMTTLVKQTQVSSTMERRKSQWEDLMLAFKTWQNSSHVMRVNKLVKVLIGLTSAVLM